MECSFEANIMQLQIRKGFWRSIRFLHSDRVALSIDLMRLVISALNRQQNLHNTSQIIDNYMYIHSHCVKIKLILTYQIVLSFWKMSPCLRREFCTNKISLRLGCLAPLYTRWVDNSDPLRPALPSLAWHLTVLAIRKLQNQNFKLVFDNKSNSNIHKTTYNAPQYFYTDWIQKFWKHPLMGCRR